MTEIRLRGLAERALIQLPLEGSPDLPLGPDVTVPETVPVRIEFDARETIGTARLRRGEEGIWADVTIYPDVSGKYAPAFRSGSWRQSWPKFAIGVIRPAIAEDEAHPSGVITSGTVVSVSLCRANTDPDLPPYEVVSDPTA